MPQEEFKLPDLNSIQNTKSDTPGFYQQAAPTTMSAPVDSDKYNFDISKYNPNLVNYNDIAESYQSFGDKLFNSVAQGVETGVEAIVNGVAAVGSLAYAGITTPFNDKSFMDNWLRNDLMEGLSNLDKQFKEEIVPVRQTTEDLQNPLSGWNVWTGFTNGLGFLASGLLGTGIVSGAVGKMGRLARISETVLGEAAVGLSDAEKVAKLTSKLGTKDLKNISNQLLKLEEAGEIAKGGTEAFLKYQNRLNKVGDFVGSLYSRIGESQMEAMQTYETIKSKYQEQAENGLIDPNKVEELAQNESSKVFWANMPLMFLDFFQYRNIMKGAKLAGMGKTSTGLADISIDAVKGTASGIKRGYWNGLIRNTFNVASSGFSEGLEEGIQFGIQKTAEDLADNKILRFKNGDTGEDNQPFINQFKSYLGDVVHNTADSLNNPEGQLSVGLGALLGAFGGIGSNLIHKPNKQYLEQSKNLADTYNRYREVNGVAPLNPDEIIERDGKIRLTKDVASKLNNYQLLTLAIDNAHKAGDAEAVQTLKGLQNAYMAINQTIKGGKYFNEYIERLEKERDENKNNEDVDYSVNLDNTIKQAKRFRQIFENIHNSETFDSLSFDSKQKLVYKAITAELLGQNINDYNKEFNALTARAVAEANSKGEVFDGSPDNVPIGDRQRYKELKDKIDNLSNTREKILNDYFEFEKNPVYEDFKESKNKVGNALKKTQAQVDTEYVEAFLTNPENNNQVFVEDVNEETETTDYVKYNNKVFKRTENNNFKEIDANTGEIAKDGEVISVGAMEGFDKQGKVQKLSKTIKKGQNLYRVVNGKLVTPDGQEVKVTREFLSKLKKYEEKDKIDSLFGETDEAIQEFSDELAKENNEKVLEEKINQTVDELNNNSVLIDNVNDRVKEITALIKSVKTKINNLNKRLKESQNKLLTAKNKKLVEAGINSKVALLKILTDELNDLNTELDLIQNSELPRLSKIEKALQHKIEIYTKLLTESDSGKLLTRKEIEDRINKYENSLNRLKVAKNYLERNIEIFKNFINEVLDGISEILKTALDFNYVPTIFNINQKLVAISQEQEKVINADESLFEDEVTLGKIDNLIEYTNNTIDALYELLEDEGGIKDYDIDFYLSLTSPKSLFRALEIAKKAGIKFTKSDEELLKQRYKDLQKIVNINPVQIFNIVPDFEFDNTNTPVLFSDIDDKAESDSSFSPSQKSFTQLSSSTTSRQFEDEEDTVKSPLKHNHILNKFLEFLDINALKGLYGIAKSIAKSNIQNSDVVRLKGVSFHNNPEYFTEQEVAEIGKKINKTFDEIKADKNIPVFKFIVQVNKGNGWYDTNVKTGEENFDKTNVVSTYLHSNEFDEFYDLTEFTQEQVNSKRKAHKAALDFINEKLKNNEEVILKVFNISNGIPNVNENESPKLLGEVFDESNGVNEKNPLNINIAVSKGIKDVYSQLAGLVTVFWKGKRIPVKTRNINKLEANTILYAFANLIKGNKVLATQDEYDFLERDLKPSDVINQFLYMSKRDNKNYYDRATSTLYLTDKKNKIQEAFNLNEVFNNNNKLAQDRIVELLQQQIRQVNASLLNKNKKHAVFYFTESGKIKVDTFNNYNESVTLKTSNTEPVLTINMRKPVAATDSQQDPNSYEVSLKSLYLNIEDIASYKTANSKPVVNSKTNNNPTSNKGTTTTTETPTGTNKPFMFIKPDKSNFNAYKEVILKAFKNYSSEFTEDINKFANELANDLMDAISNNKNKLFNIFKDTKEIEFIFNKINNEIGIVGKTEQKIKSDLVSDIINVLGNQAQPTEKTTPQTSNVQAKIDDIERRRNKKLDENLRMRETLAEDKDINDEDYQKIVARQQANAGRIEDESDAEYVDAVKKGDLTKDQAIQALEKVGRKGFKAYKELAALKNESTTTTPVSDIEAKKADIERRKEIGYSISRPGDQSSFEKNKFVFTYVKPFDINELNKIPRGNHSYYVLNKYGEQKTFDNYDEGKKWFDSKYDAELDALSVADIEDLFIKRGITSKPIGEDFSTPQSMLNAYWNLVNKKYNKGVLNIGSVGQVLKTGRYIDANLRQAFINLIEDEYTLDKLFERIDKGWKIEGVNINSFNDEDEGTEPVVIPTTEDNNKAEEDAVGDLFDEDESSEKEEKPENNIEITNTGNTEFDKLPSKSTTPTMTYAGIGSRQTPPEVLAQMTKVAKELSNRFTLNTGISFNGKEEGADAAFSKGTENKNLFSPEKQGSRQKEQAIAKEIHPNPNALSSGGLKLMARNTNQIFGDNLNTPVDFVLFYAKETNGIRPEGGTGQAVEMARLKGIPTINMANPNWRQELDLVLQKINNKNNDEEAPFRTVTTPYEKIEDIEQFKNWFYQRFSKTIDVTKVNKLIQGKAMGQFKDLVIYLWENAEEGTGFHEAFHAAFRLYASNRERAKLYQEFRNQEGYGNTFRGVKKKYSEFTDIEVEESLAEDFRKEVLKNPDTPVIKWNILNRFFKFIKDMFAHVFYNKTYKDIFFEKITSGYYANKKISKDYIGGTAFKLLGKSNEFTDKILNSIDVSFFNILSEYIDITNLEIKLFNDDGKSNEQIRNIYEAIYQDYLQLSKNLKDNTEVNKEFIDYIIDRNNFMNEIIPAHIKRLKELKITADVNNYETQFEEDTDDFIKVIEQSEKESNEEGVVNDNQSDDSSVVGERGGDFEKSAISINPKQTLNKKIRLLLNFNKKIAKDAEGNYVTVINDKTGLYEVFDGNLTYKKLLNQLVGIYTFADMQKRIIDLIDADVYGEHLDILSFAISAGILNKDKTLNLDINPNLAQQIRAAFLKTRNNAFATKEYADGNTVIVDATFQNFRNKEINNAISNTGTFNKKYISNSKFNIDKKLYRKSFINFEKIFSDFNIRKNKKGEFIYNTNYNQSDKHNTINLFFALTGIVPNGYKIEKIQYQDGTSDFFLNNINNKFLPENIKKDIESVIDQVLKLQSFANQDNKKVYLTYDNIIKGLKKDVFNNNIENTFEKDFSIINRLNNIYKYNYDRNVETIFEYLTVDNKNNYALALPTFYSMVSDRYNSVAPNSSQKLPEHLNSNTNAYVANSLLLKRLLNWLEDENSSFDNRPTISVDYNNGDIPYYENSKSGIPNDNMGEPNRLKQAFNFVLEGIHTNYKEGDKKLNALFKLGEFISIDTIKEAGFYNNFYNNVLRGYLIDEVSFNIQNGVSSNNLPLINTIFQNSNIFKNKTNEEILEILVNEDAKVFDSIVKETRDYFEDTLINEKIIPYLKDNNILFNNKDNKTFTLLLNNNRISALFGNKVNQTNLNETNLNRLLKYIVLNQFAGRQEILKLFIGSPSQFKNFEEFIKRVSSTAASKVYPDVSEQHIENLNTLYGNEFKYTDRLKVQVLPEISEPTFKNKDDIENLRKILSIKYEGLPNKDELVQKEIDAYQGVVEGVLNRKTYSGKVTTLKDNQIFVFGSNIGSSKGNAPTHGAGAAKLAKEKFGAIQGQSRGIQGKSYAIVTKKYYDVKKSSTPQEIIEEIKGLYEYAKQNSNKEFLVSDYSENNLNGYTGQEMADMFNAAGLIPSNIVFNENFNKLINNTQQQEELNKNKKVSKAPEHSDGFGRMNPYKYKQFMISIGRWGDNKEAAFQEIMNNPNDKSVLEKYANMFPIEKLQYYGIDANGKSIILKFSVMPVFRQYFNDSAMYDATQDADLVVYPSAIKGFKFNGLQEFPFEYLGLQVENPQKTKEEINLITQFEKSIYQALYKNGELNIPELKGKLEQINKLKAAVIVNNDRISLKKIGINSDGTVEDNRLLVEYLNETATASGISENSKLAIQQLINQLNNNKEFRPLNLLIDSDRMYPVIQSIFGKVIKYKKRGMQLVQFPASALGYDLQFYQDGSMEVLLPASFKGKSKNEVNEFLETVAARIPVEGLTSIEKLKVAGYLPSSLGNAIGLPNGIVAKSGTDYDFDKLNVYFPYFDNKGNPLKYYSNPTKEELDLLFKEFYNKEILLDKDYRELQRNYKKALEVELAPIKDLKARFLVKYTNKLNALYGEKQTLIQDKKGLSVTPQEYKDAKANLFVLKNDLKELLSRPTELLLENEEEAIVAENVEITELKKKIDYYNSIIERAVSAKEIQNEINKIDEEFKVALEYYNKQKAPYEAQIAKIKEKLKEDIESLKANKLNNKLRSQFDSLSIEAKNGNKRLENAILSNYVDILSNPTVQSYMLAPSNVEELKKIAYLFKPEINDKNKFEGIINPIINEKQAVINNVSKKQVGPAALHTANQNLTQIANVLLSSTLPFQNLLNSSLGINKDMDGIPIFFRLRDYSSGFVDAAKDAWVYYLNLNEFVSDCAIILSRLGLNRATVAAFTTHPAIKSLSILKEYGDNGLLRKYNETDNQIDGYTFETALVEDLLIPLMIKAGVSKESIDKTFYYKGNLKNVSNNQIIRILNQFNFTDEFPYVESDNIENNPVIVNNLKYKEFNFNRDFNSGKNLSKKEAREWLSTINAFYKTKTNAVTPVLEMMMGTNYDTAGVAKTILGVYKQLNNTNKLNDNKFIENINNIFANTFIGDLYNYVKTVPQKQSNLDLMSNPAIKEFFNTNFLNYYGKYISEDKYIKLSKTIEKHFIYYLLSTAPLEILNNKSISDIDLQSMFLNGEKQLESGINTEATELVNVLQKSTPNKVYDFFSLFNAFKLHALKNDNVSPQLKLFFDAINNISNDSVIVDNADIVDNNANIVSSDLYKNMLVNYISFVKFADDIKNDKLADILEDMLTNTSTSNKGKIERVLSLYTIIAGLKQSGYKFTPTSFNKSIPSIPLMNSFINPAFDYFQKEVLNDKEQLNSFLNEFMKQFYRNMTNEHYLLNNKTINIGKSRKRDINNFLNTGTIYINAKKTYGKPLVKIGFNVNTTNNNKQYLVFSLVRESISPVEGKLKYVLVSPAGVNVKENNLYMSVLEYYKYNQESVMLNEDSFLSKIGSIDMNLPEIYDDNAEVIDEEELTDEQYLSYEVHETALNKEGITKEIWNKMSETAKKARLECLSTS